MSETTTWPDDFSTEEFAYLTTIGRSSGKPHRIQIWFAVDNGRVYLMSGGRDRSDWVKNLKENPVITLEIGDEKRAGVATILAENTPSDALARELLAAKYGHDRDLSKWKVNSLPIVVMFGTSSSAS